MGRWKLTEGWTGCLATVRVECGFGNEGLEISRLGRDGGGRVFGVR